MLLTLPLALYYYKLTSSVPISLQSKNNLNITLTTTNTILPPNLKPNNNYTNTPVIYQLTNRLN